MFNIHGHTPTDNYAYKIHEPYKDKTSLNLDTGCCYDSKMRGHLTRILLPEETIIQIKRK